LKSKYRITNKEPQNDEGCTSTFNISCSIFCGSKIVFHPRITGEMGNKGFKSDILSGDDNSINTMNSKNPRNKSEG